METAIPMCSRQRVTARHGIVGQIYLFHVRPMLTILKNHSDYLVVTQVTYLNCVALPP